MAVTALGHVPPEIRVLDSVSAASDLSMINEIIYAVSIPVIARGPPRSARTHPDPAFVGR